MADLKTYSGYKKQNFVVEAYSMKSIFFETPHPNYFRIQNQGEGTLYCGVSHQPTERHYDFSVAPDGLKMYADPFDRSVLFVFNPSGSDIPVALTSFAASFDPLALALGDMSFDFSGVVLETQGTIGGFTTSLPEGNNTIGKVQVTGSLPAGSNKIGNVSVTGALPAGTNHIGKVEVSNPVDYEAVLSYIENHLSTLKTNQKDYTAALTSILAELDKDAYSSILSTISGKQKDYTTALANILAAIGNISVSGGGGGSGGAEVFSAVQMVQGAATTASTQVNESGIVTIHFLTNDGTNQITVYFGGIPVFLKAGESIQDFKFNGSVSVGSGATFRAMVTAG